MARLMSWQGLLLLCALGILALLTRPDLDSFVATLLTYARYEQSWLLEGYLQIAGKRYLAGR